VPPTPLKVSGLSNVTPAVSIVFTPDVAAKVSEFALATTVMPVEAFKFPYSIVPAAMVNAPAYPVGFTPSVKSKFLKEEEDENVIVPVPAVILNEMLLASVTAVGVIVRAVALAFVQIICGVPVTAIVVEPAKIVPVLFKEIVFVPNANVPVKPVQVRV
jgi:hypothetical protein